MTLNSRLALVAGLIAAGLFAGCGSSNTNTDGGSKTDAGASESCLDDSDCPDSSLFFCNTLTSKCEAACRVKEDCSAAKRGEYALDYCSGNLGCECDEGKCVASLCSADADCGGTLVCRNGACVSAPAASQVTRCMVTPDFVIVPEGTPVKFQVSTWAGTEPLVLKDGFSWTPAASPASTGFEATVTVASGTQSVSVSAGPATCTAKVIALPPTFTGLRVVVTDELTGRPVTGTKVVLSDASGAALDTQMVDAINGTASFAGATGTVTVTAFNANYNYLTVANYDTAAAGASKDLSLVIRRNQTDNYGGYKGTFTNVPTTPNIKLGIASASLAGSVTDLSLTQLLGPTEPTDVKIGTIVDQQDVPLPAGVFLAYDVNNIKPNVSAQGLAGVCMKEDMSGPDEASIAAGTCGTRSAWAVAGDVPLSELSGAASSLTGGLSGINFGQLLSQLLPVFRRFNSSVVRDVQFTLKKTTFTGNTPDFSDVAHFSQANHDFQQIPLGFNFALKFADLPKFKGSYVDGLVLLGGVIAPGRGVVPLGLGVGVNQSPADAKVDKQGALPSAGLAGLRMAPAHHGLEGSTYGVVALGASLKSATDSTAGIGTSALFARIPSNKLVFDPKGATPIDLSGEAFLTIQEDAKYNFLPGDYLGLAGRTFKFTKTPDLAGVSVVRVTFYGNDDKRWTVLASPSNLQAGSFRLPEVPSGLTDRTFATGNANGERSDMLVQTVRLATESGAAVSFTQLVENNGTNADRMNDLTRAFTIMGFVRPKVEWITPASNSTTSLGSSFNLVVSNFRVGEDPSTADGYVTVSCGNGANQSVSVKAYSDQAKGELTGSLPSGCAAGTVTFSATLVDTSGAPVQPAASATNTVKLQ